MVNIYYQFVFLSFFSFSNEMKYPSYIFKLDKRQVKELESFTKEKASLILDVGPIK